MKTIIIMLFIIFFASLASASIVSQRIDDSGVYVKFSDNKTFSKTSIQFQKEFADYKKANPTSTIKDCQTAITSSIKQSVFSSIPYYSDSERMTITLDNTGKPIELVFEDLPEIKVLSLSELIEKNFYSNNSLKKWVDF